MEIPVQLAVLIAKSAQIKILAQLVTQDMLSIIMLASLLLVIMDNILILRLPHALLAQPDVALAVLHLPVVNALMAII